MTDYKKRNYEPVSLDSGDYKILDVSGWFRLSIESADYKLTSGGFDSIKLKMTVVGTEYEGTLVFHDIIIPPIDKAFSKLKSGDGYDYDSPTFWMRRTGWSFQIFGCYIDINPEPGPKRLCLWTDSGKIIPLKEQVIEAIINKFILGNTCVGYLEPGTYTDKKDGKVKNKAILKELRGADYVPDIGFIGEEPMLPDTTDYDLDKEDEEYLID